MHDVAHLKDSVDLREWIERDLNAPVVSRGSSAWTFKCPFHGETHGASLAVYNNTWKCWGACKMGGDLFDWIAHWHRLDIKRDFARIVRIAGGSLDSIPTGSQTPKPVSEKRQVSSESPSLEWQTAGRTLLESAQRALWSSGGSAARQYLSSGRALTEDTIRTAQLGYVAQSDRKWQECGGLLVPTHSVLIPWLADGVLWGIKCRRLGADEPRYAQVRAAKGFEKRLGESNLSGALYWADPVRAGVPLFVVEGEFNCLSMWQEAGQLVSPVSVGTSGQSIAPRWFMRFLNASSVFSWFDHDPAGQKGAERLAEFSSRVHTVALPPGTGKDINDLLRSGAGAVKGWVETVTTPFPEAPVISLATPIAPLPAAPIAPLATPVAPPFSEDMCRAADGTWSFEWIDRYFDRFPGKAPNQVEPYEWVRASVPPEQVQKFKDWQAGSSGECPVSLPLFHALTCGMNLSVLDDQLTRIGMDFMERYDEYATAYSYALRAVRCKLSSLPFKKPTIIPPAAKNLSVEVAPNVVPEPKPVNPIDPPVQSAPRSASQRRALASARTGVSYPARTALQNKTYTHEEDVALKATIVAKPKSHEITPTGAVKLVIDFQYEKPVAFPKGVPPLPNQPFTVTAFVGSKQWKKVEPTLADSEDRLILDGQFAVDPVIGLVLHCTNASSLKLQRAGKETPAEPKAEGAP